MFVKVLVFSVFIFRIYLFLDNNGRACTQSSSDFKNPSRVTDGIYFSQQNQALRLENANNIFLQNQFQIAMWVKLHDISTLSTNYKATLLSQYRYDQYSYLEDPNFQIGLATNLTNNKLGLWFSAKLLLSTVASYNIALIQETTLVQNANIKEGWTLLFLALDSSSQSNTRIQVRLRTQGSSDNLSQTFPLYIYNSNLTKNYKYDMNIGALCSRQTSKYEQGPIGITIGRMYIWKSAANVQNDVQFDRFFFRQTTSNPICKGSIPCSYCVMNYPFPTTVQIPQNLSCSTENQPKASTYLALWDFDFDDAEVIQDQSGNGYHLYRDPVDEVEDQGIWRIFGQGYLFDYLDVVYVRPYPLLDRYDQFSVDMWIRKNSNGYYDTNQILTFNLLNIRNSSRYDFFGLQASDQQNFLAVVVMEQATYLSGFTNFLTSSKWYYLQYSLYWVYKDGNYHLFSKAQVDTQIVNGYKLYYSPFSIDPSATMRLISARSLFINKVRVYGYARTQDEATLTMGINTQCKKLGNQSQCDICPIETGQCLSTCNQDQLSPNCTQCHPLCGHCNSTLLTGCTYCSRNPSSTFAHYSETYGNCTCITGYYYNATSKSCNACSSQCKQCFGPSKSECLTCNTGKVFFPPTICVDNCYDSLVTSSFAGGFYQANDTINGQTFSMCSKCHPSCTACWDSGNNKCSSCADGYLLINGDTCSDNCPTGFYADMTLKKCQPCDTSCETCSGPSSSQCLICKNSSLYQQNGVCQAACNNNYYGAIDHTCQPCHPSCATCLTAYSTNCSACNSGYYLEWLGFSCKESCGDGFYEDDLTNQCLLCHYSCQTCNGSGPDKCLKCANNFLRRGAFCVTSCQDDEFAINGVCQTCDPKCTTCFGVKDTQCYSCAENALTGIGYFFINNSCVEKCPDGYYPDNLQRQCKKCKDQCATCTSYNYCTSCILGPYKLNDGECTYFTCMTTQYRGLRPSLKCFDCDQSCLTCQGFSQFDCLTCKSQYQFVAQQCLTCDDQPGMTKSKDESVTKCIEICGDGFNYGMVQCDDGNNIDGDGCSSICTVEEGYSCKGGSKLTPDICTDIKNPQAKIALINSKNQIYITFDKEVSLQDTLDMENLAVSIQGPQTDYQFDWKLNDDYKTTSPVQIIVLDLTFYQSLKGDKSETVTIQFLSTTVYQDSAGNGVLTVPLTDYLNQFEYIDPATKAKLDAASQSSMLATIGGVSLNLLISLIFGGTVQAQWVMVNTIQLVSLLPLCNVNYPKITILVFNQMLSSHGEPEFLPNLIYDKLLNRTGSSIEIEEALNDRFNDYGWIVSNFLYLSGRKIIIMAAMILSYPIVWYMKKRYANKHKICSIWNYVEEQYRYTMLLRTIIMSYVSLYLAGLLNIFQMSFSTVENVVSIFSAIAFLILLTYLPVQIMNILQRNYAKIQTEKFMLQYSTIVEEVDLSHPLRYMYYPVFLMRRALFALELVVFEDSPVAQISLMSLTSFVMLLYIIILRPQKERIMIILNATGELLLLFLHLFSIAFLDDTLPESKSTQLGWFIIVIVGLYVLVNWIIIMYITIKDLCKQYKEYKKKKSTDKVQEKEEEQYKIWKKKREVKKRMERERERQHLILMHDEKALEFYEQKIQEEEMKDKMNQETIQQESQKIDLTHDEGSPNPFFNETLSKYLLNSSMNNFMYMTQKTDLLQQNHMLNSMTNPLYVHSPLLRKTVSQQQSLQHQGTDLVVEDDQDQFSLSQVDDEPIQNEEIQQEQQQNDYQDNESQMMGAQNANLWNKQPYTSYQSPQQTQFNTPFLKRSTEQLTLRSNLREAKQEETQNEEISQFSVKSGRANVDQENILSDGNQQNEMPPSQQTQQLDELLMDDSNQSQIQQVGRKTQEKFSDLSLEFNS